MLAFQPATPRAQDQAAQAGSPSPGRISNYIIGPQDVLTITVWGQNDLTGKYSVEADGTFTYHFVGRLKVGGLTLVEVEDLVRTRLRDGYLRNPQVTVSVDQYKSQKIYVMGYVRSPGPYPLTGPMTMIEALALAGGATAEASTLALIVRPQAGSEVDGPLLPSAAQQADVIEVDIGDLQTGRLSHVVALRANDTVFLQRAELVYVYGQVNTPGGYSVQRGATVIQALSLAGGATDRAATNRIRIRRLVDGKREEIKATLEDAVLPGDTITVPERFF